MGSSSFVEWPRDEDFSKYIYSLEETQEALLDIEDVIENYYVSNSTLEGLFIEDEGHFNDVHRPNYGGIGGVGTISAFLTIGGTQSLEIKVLKFEDPCSINLVKCTIEVTVGDLFGAGVKDGKRWLIPGLPSQFILQHYRNEECFLEFEGTENEDICYTPLLHLIRFCHEFEFTIAP